MSTATYRPEGLAINLVADIMALFHHPKTKVMPKTFTGQKFMCKLPGGQTYYDSKLDLDTDGSAFAAEDPDGQAATSAKDVDGNSLDSDAVNYFVLPGGFPELHNIRIGDIGVVIFGIRTAFACFGDVGPKTKLGEGSISLHRELGFERIKGGHLINSGISSGVITIVFPRSGNGLGRSNRESEAIGRLLLQQLNWEGQSFDNTLEGIYRRRMGFEHDPLGISNDGWTKVRRGFSG